MSSASRFRVVATILLLVGAGLVMAVLATGDTMRLGMVIPLVILTTLRAADMFAGRTFQPKEQDDRWQLGEAIFVVAALTLDPAGVVLVAVLGPAIGLAASRLQPAKIASNLGVELISVASGLWVLRLLGGVSGRIDSAELAAAGLAALAFFAVGLVVVASGLAWVNGRPVRESLSVTKFVFVQLSCSIAIGLLAAASSEISPFAPVLAIPPVAMVQMVLGEHFRARVARTRIDGLFQTAVEAHASVLSVEVEHALYRSATRLLRCGAATIEVRPPGTDEWGVQVAGHDGTGRWLIVSRHESGEPLEDDDIKLLEAIGAIGSAALENARLVEEIRRQAIHDPVSGLANHVLFEDRVAQAATVAWRSRERFAVVMLDLDSFKKVNDSLGHATGNRLLRAMGERLTATVREVDTVARLGSDHFTLLLPGVGTAQTAGVMTDRLLEAVRRPFLLDGQELFMTASAGIAFYPSDGTQSGHLLRNADSAMHRAKDLGRNCYQVYSSAMNEQAHLRLARESELHNALLRDELTLRYQPQVDLRSGTIVGVEALVRWDHPVLGLIGPFEFVPLAEESGLIVELDEWVLREACGQLRQWLAQGLPPVRVAVNLSGRHFQTPDRLYRTIQTVLDDTGIDPTLLELEVTEGIAVGEAHGAIEVLHEVRALGVQVAIDDFGTGYSMLGRLQQFPVDRLKIDRSFVNEIAGHHGEAPIVSAMIAMGRSLHLEVVAEGVETLEQHTFLRQHGCDLAQGFLFSRPVEADQLAALLQNRSIGLHVATVS